MTAEFHLVPPLHPPSYCGEYSNSIDPSYEEPSNLYKRVALVALPFLSLYKPLSLPISLGRRTVRVITSTNQLISSIQSGKKISFDLLQTTIAVIALASTIFAHPIGMIVTTSQNIIFELSNLSHSLQNRDWEASLVSITKIIDNIFYLALISRGGLEIAIISRVMKAITLIVSSRKEFKKGHLLEVGGNLLMATIRIHQGYSQFKVLQQQWEIEEAMQQGVINELHAQ